MLLSNFEIDLFILEVYKILTKLALIK